MTDDKSRASALLAHYDRCLDFASATATSLDDLIDRLADLARRKAEAERTLAEADAPQYEEYRVTYVAASGMHCSSRDGICAPTLRTPEEARAWAAEQRRQGARGIRDLQGFDGTRWVRLEAL